MSNEERRLLNTESAYILKMEKNMKKIIAILLLLATMVLPLASCKKDEPSNDNNETDNNSDKQPEPELPGVDFLNDDLSEYVEIDEKYYKGFTVTFDPSIVKTLDVENSIIQTLCKHKNKTPVEGDGVISVGDVAHIYYRGYYMKGEEKYFFQGGDNTASEKPYSLEIGSGGFIPGFEYNLIGKKPADYSEENPIVVETFFPEKYHSDELAGKTAYFIVTVVKLEEYEAPTLDDAFVTETLMMSERSLSGYKGETLADKYRDYIKEEMLREKGLDLETLILDAFWKSVIDGAVVKKYPEKQLKESYDSLVYELEYYYNNGYAAYYKYDDFMCLYIGLDVGSDWKSKLNEIAKSQIKQQLIFYHIMNVEGLKPTDEEFYSLFDEYLIPALAESGITPDKYATEEEYLAEKEKYKTELIRKHGEDYFKTMIYYEVTVNAIKDFANVVEITE